MRRAANEPAYQPTEPKLGGLRCKDTPSEYATLVNIGRKRAVKVLPVFRWYSNEPAIAPRPGFVILGLHDYKEADVIVLQRLADIDTVCHDQLVLGPVTTEGACVDKSHLTSSRFGLDQVCQGLGSCPLLWSGKDSSRQAGHGGIHEESHSRK